MEFFRIQRDIPFMRHALIFNIISVLTFVIAVGALGVRGLHLGVDFTGGTVMEIRYCKEPQPETPDPNVSCTPTAADLGHIRDAVTRLGFTDAAVQNFGSSADVMVRLPVKQGLTSAQLSEKVMAELRKVDKGAKLQRVEFVGPQVGRELLENGALALLFVSIGIVLYLWLRFEWKFG